MAISNKERKELDELLEDSTKITKEELESGYEELPEGEYEAFIDEMEIKESKSGNLMLVWKFEVTDGEYEGEDHYKYSMLNDAKNMKRVTTELEKFGHSISKFSDLEDCLEDMLDEDVTITIEIDGTYTNTSVDPLDD